MGGDWECLEMQAREVLEYCKQSSMGDPFGSLDQHANRYKDSKDCAPEVSKGNKDYVGK